MFDPASLVVNVQVTQRDLPYVRSGCRSRSGATRARASTFEGVVSVVSPVIDAAAGTVPVRIAIKDYERLKPGLFVAGRIVLEAKPNTLVVPRKAVLYERERPYVMKVVTRRATRRASRASSSAKASRARKTSRRSPTPARSARPTASCSSATTGSATGTTVKIEKPAAGGRSRIEARRPPMAADGPAARLRTRPQSSGCFRADRHAARRRDDERRRGLRLRRGFAAEAAGDAAPRDVASRRSRSAPSTRARRRARSRSWSPSRWRTTSPSSRTSPGYRSVSRAGGCDVILEFAWKTPMTFAVQEVREKLDQLQTRLPRGVERPLVLRYDPTFDPILRIGALRRRRPLPAPRVRR